MKSSSLKFDTIANLIVRSTSVVAAFALTAILAQTLGVVEFGRYSLLIAIVTLLSIPAQAGVSELVLRETAKSLNNKNWSRMYGVWIWSTHIVVISSIIIVVSSAISLLIVDWKPSGTEISTIIFAMIFIPLAALGAIRGAILRGLGYVIPGLLPEYVIRPLSAILFVLIYKQWDIKVASKDAIYIYVLASALSFVMGAAMLWKFKPIAIRRKLPLEIDSITWRNSAIILASMAGMAVILQQIDVIMIGIFSSDDQVGLYRVAGQFSLVVSFGLTATLSAIAPHIIRAHGAGDFGKIRLLAVYSARFTTIIAVTSIICIFSIGNWILSVMFGAEFSAAMPSLIVLSISQAVVSIVGPVSVLLVMTGYERVSAKIMAITILINITANLLFIPKFGSLGAAIGTGAAIIVQHLLLSIAVRNKLGFSSTAFSPARKLI